MHLMEYVELVKSTDQFATYDEKKRLQISLYGLVGEIGSLTSAVKKAMLAEYKHLSNEEIEEELGDVLWYLFNLVIILDPTNSTDILKNDVAHIRQEVTDSGERGKQIRSALEHLDGAHLDRFLERADAFLAAEETDFNEYQKTAYLTARTEGHVLNDVCLAVLWQLGAELLRQFTMPDAELDINQNIEQREKETIIGEIAWHLAALASLRNIELGRVLERNARKARFRSQTELTPIFHDQDYPNEEQLPRRFAIQFVSTSATRARMYFGGRPLGDDLTDNSYDEDGYRFHDVMHLANVACLHWSPVLRALMKRKRKSNRKTDEVEDGARALIVEELVIKAIHAEGKRLYPNDGGEDHPFFPEMGHITFGLVKMVSEYARGLEVEVCQAWQWRKAIFEGSRVYCQLRREGQGTVTVDMDAATLSFDPRVVLGLSGVVRQMGTATAIVREEENASPWLSASEESENAGNFAHAEVVATKQAILDALGIPQGEADDCREDLELSRTETGKFSVKASGQVLDKMWETGVLEFKSTVNQVDDVVVCTVLGLGDPKDAVP